MFRRPCWSALPRSSATRRSDIIIEPIVRGRSLGRSFAVLVTAGLLSMPALAAAGCVNVNATLGDPPDILFRGFEASPVLGSIGTNHFHLHEAYERITRNPRPRIASDLESIHRIGNDGLAQTQIFFRHPIGTHIPGRTNFVTEHVTTANRHLDRVYA